MARKALYAVKRPENWLLEPPSTSGREGEREGKRERGRERGREGGRGNKPALFIRALGGGS